MTKPRESARQLLLIMQVDAVRYAEAKGIDVWAIYCGRHDDPARFRNMLAGATVGCAMALIMPAMRRATMLMKEAGVRF